MATDVPYDLIKEVLLWLPVKSLLRFNCLSKSWNQIIDSPDFINSHLDKSSKNRLHRKLIHFYSYTNLKKICVFDINNGFQEDFLPNFGCPTIRLRTTAYCHGLVLSDQSSCKFFVLNPSTRHYRELHGFPVHYKQFYGKYYRFGFGHDPITDDYKVVLLVASDSYYAVLIFGLKSSCWRRLEDFPYIEYDNILGNSFANGCVHFLLYASLRQSYMIVSFDLEKETFSVVPQPNYEAQKGYPGCLEAFEGCLSIRYLSEGKIHQYVRRKEGVELTWTKLFSLTIVQAKKENMHRYFRIVGYSKEGDKILFLCCGNMYSYDLKGRSLQQIETTNIGSCCCCSILFTESLALGAFS